MAAEIAQWVVDCLALVLPVACLVAVFRRQTARIAALRPERAGDQPSFSWGGLFVLAMIVSLTHGGTWAQFSVPGLVLALLLLRVASLVEVLWMLAALYLLGSPIVPATGKAPPPFDVADARANLWLLAIGFLIVGLAAGVRWLSRRNRPIALDAEPDWRRRAAESFAVLGPIGALVLLLRISGAGDVARSEMFEAVQHALVIGAGLALALAMLNALERWYFSLSPLRRENFEISAFIVALVAVIAWFSFVARAHQPELLIGYIVLAGLLISDPTLRLTLPPDPDPQKAAAERQQTV